MKNKLAKNIKTATTILIVLMVIGSLGILGNEYLLDELKRTIFIWTIITGVITWMFFFGMAEMINLLEEIKNNTKKEK